MIASKLKILSSKTTNKRLKPSYSITSCSCDALRESQSLHYDSEMKLHLKLLSRAIKAKRLLHSLPPERQKTIRRVSQLNLMGN